MFLAWKLRRGFGSWDLAAKARYVWLPRFSIVLLGIGALLALWLAFDPDTLESLAWLMAGSTFLGIILTAWTTRDSYLELQAIDKLARGDRVLTAIAWANVRRDAIRIIKLAALFIISMQVTLKLSNPFVSRSMLVLVIVLMVANSFLDRLERQQTAEILRNALNSKRYGG